MSSRAFSERSDAGYFIVPEVTGIGQLQFGFSSFDMGFPTA
jgi:hypothetical protein